MRNVEPFVRVAEAGSFRRGAERLGLTPAAVSKAVARLEEELGVRLLERTSRRVSLTREGRAFLPHARAALDALQAGLDEVAEARDRVEGTARLTLPHLLGPPLLRRLPELVARHPHLTFDVRLTDALVDLAAADVDVALRIGALDPATDLVAHPLGRLVWATVASPRYLGRHGTPVQPADLDAHRCGVFRSPTGRAATWHFRSGDRDVFAALHVDRGDLLVDAALADLCVVQAFGWMVESAVARGDLVEILAHEAAPGPSLHALHLPHRRRMPRIRAVIAFLRDRLAIGGSHRL